MSEVTSSCQWWKKCQQIFENLEGNRPGIASSKFTVHSRILEECHKKPRYQFKKCVTQLQTNFGCFSSSVRNLNRIRFKLFFDKLEWWWKILGQASRRIPSIKSKRFWCFCFDFPFLLFLFPSLLICSLLFWFIKRKMSRNTKQVDGTCDKLETRNAHY